MFWMGADFSRLSKEEIRIRLREKRLFHIRNLIKKFVKTREKGDFTTMRKVGFHLIPLLDVYTVDEIRSLFQEIEQMLK